MAEEEKEPEEEALVIEDDEETLEDEHELKEEDQEEPKEEEKNLSSDEEELLELWRKYKTLILFVLSLIGLILFFAVLFFIFNKQPSLNKEEDESLAKKLSQKEKLKKILKKSDVERLLEKANLLYANGEKEKALEIYHQIALYNESISYYNLGVSQLKEDDFLRAYHSFKKALQNRENVVASAINIAVCALQLGKEKEANYYLDLAKASIDEEVNSPIYSYYFELINYYKHRPIKALAASLSPTSSFYAYNDHKIASEVYLQMNEFVGALNSLSKNEDVKDSFTLGLLHSKIGEYELAITQFERALENNLDVNKTTQALLLAYLKNSNFKKAAALINHMPRNYPWKEYPIEVFLKPRLFDIDLAQDYFKEKFFFDKEKIYSLIFYFSPYQIFDPKKVLKLSEKDKQALASMR